MNTTITNNSLPKFPQATNNPGSSSSATAAATAAPTDAFASATRSPDQLKLTDSARAVQEATRLNKDSPMDTKRVEELRQALADGTYKVDAGRIADRLLSLDQQLGGTGKA